MKNIYETLIEQCTNERLDEIAFQNKDFCAVDKKLNEALAYYDTLSISKQDAKSISRIFDLYAEQVAILRQIAYQQGIKDTIDLLKSLGLIIGK